LDAGIEEFLHLAQLGKKKAKLNDHVVLMHMKRVASQEAIHYCKTGVLISSTAVDNPNRVNCTYLSFKNSIKDWHSMRLKT
jgi:hypothetical protein